MLLHIDNVAEVSYTAHTGSSGDPCGGIPVILIGIGGNLECARFGPPRDTLSAALAALEEKDIRILTCSGWYRTEPVPRSDQPWFVNGVVSLGTELAANDLLIMMQATERQFGRVRGEPNAPRI